MIFIYNIYESSKIIILLLKKMLYSGTVLLTVDIGVYCSVFWLKSSTVLLCYYGTILPMIRLPPPRVISLSVYEYEYEYVYEYEYAYAYVHLYLYLYLFIYLYLYLYTSQYNLKATTINSNNYQSSTIIIIDNYNHNF